MIYLSIDIESISSSFQNDFSCTNETNNEVGTPPRLIRFYKTRTFLCKKTLYDDVRVLDLYPDFTPTIKFCGT